MRVAFFHGLESKPISSKSEYLKDNMDFAYCPAMDYKNPKMFDIVLKEVTKNKVDLLIGSSMGGWFAYCLSTITGIPTLLLNPALHSRTYDPKVKLGKLTPKQTLVLGNNDTVITPKETEQWMKDNYTSNYVISHESNGHRTPPNIMTKYLNPMLNEEWSTESPGDAFINILPENLKSFAVIPEFNESEIKEIINHQNIITDEDISFAKLANSSVDEVFYRWLVLRGEKPSMSELNSIGWDPVIYNTIDIIKKQIKRPRPFKFNPQIKPLVELTNMESFSYPSFHSIIGWFLAKKMALRYPHLEDGLFTLAERIALSRVQSGVHFPSDIKPGKDIANKLIELGM